MHGILYITAGAVKKTVYVQKKPFCSLWNNQSLTPYAATFSTMNTLKPTVKNCKGV